MKILIKNGRVIDPANDVDDIRDIYVADGVIISPAGDFAADKVIDAAGMWVTPGFVDLHVHLRDPGLTHKEDIKSGTAAAAMGGYTTICAMPNTKPVMDNPALVKETYEKIQSDALINVLIIGAATCELKGETLADIDGMKQAGICAVSEDGFSILDSLLTKKAFVACAKADLPMFSHCEDLKLVNGGVINEGVASERFGMPGISNDSEDVIAVRDIILAKSTGARLHLCHVSTKGSVDIIKAAKALNVNITAECCPHHFTLSDEDILTDDGNYKMNPPLRSLEDKKAITEALKDDTIEIIATDHAPHHEDEKTGGFKSAMNGIVGLETALPLCITELVEGGVLTPSKLIEKMAWVPAKVLGIKAGALTPGYPADIAIIDFNTPYEIDISKFKSKGKNTPFNGKKVKGKIGYLIKSGKIIVNEGGLK
ncbi:MAG: dihydroorotase [Defluviitaleaceae bacterium]|nr:dihydroorotase [Defluviitaleaceae bacterium]